MDTVTPTQPPGTTGDDGKRRWDAGIRAGVISAVVGVLALIVALLTWLLPQDPGGGKDAGGGAARADGTPDASIAPSSGVTGAPAPGASGAPAPGASGTPTATGAALPPGSATAAGSATTYLGGAAFRPESGAADVVDLPRAIKGDPGYTGHQIAIRCPSNQTGDQTTDVTYLLQGRYVQFDATVHPYFPAGTDRNAVTYVTALIGIRQPDGGLDTTVAGDQKRASAQSPAALSAAVDHAEKLTLRIQCGNPNGTIVLTSPRLTAP